MKNTKPHLHAIRPLCALAAAGLFLADFSAHAAPTVYNVNVGDSSSPITTVDNYIGAATENTANSTWNAVASTSAVTLADSTGITSAGVTFQISPSVGSAISFGSSPALLAGDEIFKTWIKDGDGDAGGPDGGNDDPYTITFGNLDPAYSYSVVVYSDWWWGPSNQPVSLTPGSGLTGTFNINSLQGSPTTPTTNGHVGPLLEDTDPTNTNVGYTNYARFNALTADAGGNLVFTAGGANAPINGFQLIQIPPPPATGDAGTSTVVAAPASVQANGAVASTVTVSLKDAGGQPVGGKEVTLANTSGPQAAAITPATAQTTPASGVVTFQVSSSTPGTEVFTATDTTDSVVITQTASVEFLATVPTNGALSTVVASPLVVPADGTSTSTVTVTLKESNGLPVSGKGVTLAGAPASATILPAWVVTTDLTGVASFTVSSSTSGPVVFTATSVDDGNLLITQTASVNFVGTTNAGQSTVAATHPSVVANGSSATTITVTLKDASGLPVEGNTVALAGNPGNATITPVSPVTNASGVATFTVSSSTVGTELFTATDTTDSVVIAQTASVNFVDVATPLAFNFNFYNAAQTPVLDDPALLEGPAPDSGLGETWNQSKSTSSVNNDTVTSNLVSSTGVLTGVGVICNTFSSWPLGNPVLKMLRAGAAQFNNTDPVPLTITGLPPGSYFDVYIASARTDGSEETQGTWSTTNETLSSSSQPVSNVGNINGTTWLEGNNYVAFQRVKVNASGQLVFNGEPIVGVRRVWANGFQLVPTGPPQALITSFGIPGSAGVIDQNAKTISLTVPSGTSLATLAPDFTLSAGATCNQTSGSPPSPTFASANPATYTVTDTSTEPDTENIYTVTVIVPPPTTTVTYNLGASPGTEIQPGIGGLLTWIEKAALPAGSILRSISVNAVLESVGDDGIEDDFASDLLVYIDPAPENPGTAALLQVGGYEAIGTVQLALTDEPNGTGWANGQDSVIGTTVIDTKNEASWSTLGAVDLSTVRVSVGNDYSEASWSGTITLTYDLVGGGNTFANWIDDFSVGGQTGVNGDYDNDNLGNAVENLLGTSPEAFSQGLNTVSSSGGNLVFRHTRNTTPASDLTGSYEWSVNLVDWNASGASAGGTTVTFGEPVVITPGTPDVVEVTATVAGTSPGKIFARFKATQN